MMSVEYNYKKSFCIKYLLKFKNPTEVCREQRKSFLQLAIRAS